MAKFRDQLKKTRFRVSLPFISYEVSLDDLLNTTSVDERIASLNRVHEDLLGAVAAVEGLQSEALERKHEVEQLEETVRQLNQDRSTAESLLNVPEESFTRLLARATSKGRTRGIIEGSVIGFATGTLSSFFVWYLTK
jgi:hypothetical protein